MSGPDRKASSENRVELPKPLDPLKRPPLDQYCDLVLKGGVVDGVIYPGVLTELARHYRFQSIAGTSVGAIAASLAAASEYARRFGSDDGFNEVLRKIPDELAKYPDQNVQDTKLRTLFQPDEALKRLFNVFVEIASVPLKEVTSKFFRTVWTNYQIEFFNGFFFGYVIAGLVAVLTSLPVKAIYNCLLTLCNPGVMSLPVSSSILKLLHSILFGSLFGSLLAGLIVGLICIAWAIRREFKVFANRDGWGFCSGLSTDGGKTEALTEWLHKGIQGAAKLPLGRPLTFQDLWDAPGGPKQDNGQPVQKSIDLRMITTAVSHGRPYELPLGDLSVRLFFKLSELQDYFPESVIKHLADKALPYTKPEMYYAVDPTKDDDRTVDPPTDPKGLRDFRELPVGDLPVLVAVRLSMNFPILFKAVALWAVDAQAGPTAGSAVVKAPTFRKAWFTDGGVTSNFPVHVFDAPVPKWPTFGVFIDDQSPSNKYNGPDAPEPDKLPRYWLPRFHTTGRAEKWMRISRGHASNEPASDLTSAFASYLKAVIFTAKDWADHANMRMPGIRDRIVTVYKNGETNGGLNLKLEPDKIRNLSYLNGVDAGRALVRKFLTNPVVFNENLQGTPGWLDHRWVRFNSYVNALKVYLTGFSANIDNARGAATISQQIDQAKQKPPLFYEKYFEHKLTDIQAEALKKTLVAIQALEAALATDTVVQPYTPKPQPELKNRARI